MLEIVPAGEQHLAGLCAVLADCVAGGASIGFLDPLAPEATEAYWREILAGVDADLRVWVAVSGAEVVGTVQLARCPKANGRHRGEVRKLLVPRAARGQGIAGSLMAVLETSAREQGLTLLHLDTEAGSAAEFVYAHLGWTKMGEIPAYAATPDGVLRDCAFYWKRLA